MSSEVNIKQHGKIKINFEDIVNQGLKNGGIHIVASKNHGKSRLLFSMARWLKVKARTIIFDGSETWLYAFDRTATFNITDKDIILTSKPKTTEDIETYALTNWHLVELALKKHKDILFRLKTRKPSKRGFFIRQVVKYLDSIQREQKASTENHEPKQYIAYIIEEAQDCFNSRSTTRLEAEEFLTIFNEARNQKEAFFTASQRLTDFSKTIRTKQLYCIGRLSEEDKTLGIRRIEKLYNIDFSKLPQRTWYFEGKIFKSPQWKQSGKPFIINKDIKKAYIESLPKTEHKTLWQKIKDVFKPKPITVSNEDFEKEDNEFMEREWEEDTITEEFEDYEEWEI